jgi:hypothetical protein
MYALALLLKFERYCAYVKVSACPKKFSFGDIYFFEISVD